MGTLPTEAEVKGYLSALSNWGRWGADDELGTINRLRNVTGSPVNPIALF